MRYIIMTIPDDVYIYRQLGITNLVPFGILIES